MLDLAEVTALITREAMLLDRRCWREWLDLYSEDSVFWMPAWLDEDTTTSDPDAELSHIYYKGRHNLEDRVWRATSGMSRHDALPIGASTGVHFRRRQVRRRVREFNVCDGGQRSAVRMAQQPRANRVAQRRACGQYNGHPVGQ